MASIGFKTSLLLVVLLKICCGRNVQHEWDPKGYVMYCPCMGRFGSQVDQFLGAFHFAQKIGRVLVIPPFISYQHEKGHDTPNIYVPFDNYFNLDKVKEYHPDVILMHDFMDNLAPVNWAPGQRFAYCSSRAAEFNEGACPRSGNPFSEFWDHFDIKFDDSLIWEGDLHFNVEYEPWKENWEKEYPPSKYPVIAFMSAPAISPLSDVPAGLQEYLEWQPRIAEEGEKHIAEHLQRPYVGIHLRNGADWVRTCELADGSYHQLMSSRQCTGVRHDNSAPITMEMCIQSEEQVIKELKYIVRKEQPKTIFVATDHEPMVDELTEAFPEIEVKHLDPEKPEIDMYILSQSDHFVGNCVSAFSHYVRRERDVGGKIATYFGWKGNYHDEL
ncbi:GDP-fucose protein O-fucosyltransferase 1-like isoform X2 [Anneissia japonica]|uniref:GDP-fucose protein O-fucosyltransferase 1-like isoform X2 n=1 Tax=Anneissia japonica TaxID=1529436 RepID=UPI0014259EC3|nr:GDP-fucose protein O-fucosyltransferase 1-like isoform X2 [Anneissia japonica]